MEDKLREAQSHVEMKEPPEQVYLAMQELKHQVEVKNDIVERLDKELQYYKEEYDHLLDEVEQKEAEIDELDKRQKDWDSNR